MTKTRLIPKLLIIITLLIGILPRLYKLNSPIADHHSHRQADTSSVTIHLIDKTASLFVPTYHDISNVQSGLDNPNGYRMVEMPIYNLVSAKFHQTFKNIFPKLTPEISQRLISIFFSIASAYLIYLIVYQQTKLS